MMSVLLSTFHYPMHHDLSSPSGGAERKGNYRNERSGQEAETWGKMVKSSNR